jgi:bifunctional DNase/RNase
MEVPVHVWRVGRDEESRYLLILRDDLGNPLMMTIGPCEAVSIWAALRGEPPAELGLQSMSHDLLCDFIRRLGGSVVKVVVDDFWNDVYFAKLHLSVDSTVVTVDSRPSDAVAIALRVGAPLFVQDSILESAQRTEMPPAPPAEDTDPWGETDAP